jgi:hypothetical protein
MDMPCRVDSFSSGHRQNGSGTHGLFTGLNRSLVHGLCFLLWKRWRKDTFEAQEPFFKEAPRQIGYPRRNSGRDKKTRNE